MMKKIVKILYYLFLASSIITIVSIFFANFPQSTNNNPLNPPQWLFYPMWSGLFLLISLSMKELIKKEYKNKQLRTPIILFLIQLTLNFAWGAVYGLTRSSVYGTIILIFSWFYALFTIIELRKLEKKAAYYLIPYLAWSTIAVLVSFTANFV